MGSLFSRESVQPESFENLSAADRDLLQNLISPSDWDTSSWVDCSYKREVASRPCSLTGSWVNLEFTSNLVESTTPQGSTQDLSQESKEDLISDSMESNAEDLSQEEVVRVESEDVESENEQLSCVLKQEDGLTLSELAVPLDNEDVGETAFSRSVFLETVSLQRTPIHSGKPFRSNRSWTFSGAGSEYPSPVHSVLSGASFYSAGRPYSPLSKEMSFTGSMLVSSEAKEKGCFISGLFQTHFIALVEQINPQDTAQQLYNLAILNTAELRKATNPYVDEADRAQAIVLCLKKRLRYKPELFCDVYAALKKARVEIIELIKDEIRRQFPDDTDLTRSVSVLSRPEFALDSEPESSISSQSSGPLRLSRVMVSLEEAFVSGNLDKAKKIISKEVSRKNGTSLLFEACHLEVKVCVLNLLLTEANLDVNTTSQHNRTSLHTACAALKEPLQTPPSLELQDQLKQQRMKVENLLNHGADMTAQDQDGNTALHLAALRKDCEAVAILLRHGRACIDLTNRLGNTALHIACRQGHTEVVRLLCGNGANTILPNKTRKQSTPVLMACSHEHVGVAQMIIDHDSSSLSGTDSRGRSPLHMSTKRQNSTLTDTLCEHKRVEPYTLDVENKTPLHYACYWGGVDLIAPLLNKNCSKGFINAQDRRGDTALHIASRRGHKAVIKLLISKGAVKVIKNQEGKTPVDLAAQWEHKKVVKLLNKKSPWLKRRKRRSSSNLLRRVGTTASLTSESSVDPGMVLSSAESDCDETVDY